MIQRKTIIIAAIILFIAIPVIWWLVSATISQTSSDGIITDRDTGETFNPDDTDFQTGGSIAKQSDVQLFGMENFSRVARESTIDTGGYLTALKEALWNFNEDRLDKKYPTLTVRPQDLKVSTTTFSGSIRLGQTDVVLPFSGIITPNRKSAVITINNNQTSFKGKYVYVGGVRNPNELLFSITQKNTSSSDLVIDTIPGYREPALKYIESLGYNVPDFSITFTNYEDVF